LSATEKRKILAQRRLIGFEYGACVRFMIPIGRSNRNDQAIRSSWGASGAADFWILKKVSFAEG